jgi:hypothetical protein
MCASNAIKDCPLPMIQAMIIPDFVSISFTASTHPNAANPGQLNFANKPPSGEESKFVSVTNNLWQVDLDYDKPVYQWHLASTGGTWSDACGTQKAMDVTKDIGWADDAKELSKRTLVSCGHPFWPSFRNIDPNLSLMDQNTYKLVGPCLTQRNNPTSSMYSQGLEVTTVDYPGQKGKYFRYCTFDGNWKLDPAYPPIYTTIDCPKSHTKFTDRSVTYDSKNEPVLPNARVCMGFLDDNEEGTFKQACDCDAPLSGSVESFQVKMDTWETLQFEWCTGKDRVTFAGVTLERYQPGGAFCDDLVGRMCADSSFVNTPVCRCFREQTRIQAQFSGIDLPVQCFMDACGETGDGAYRTKEQQSGCSAKICQQIIKINGSSILSQGYQTLECNNQIYRVGDDPSNGGTDTTSSFFDPTDGLNAVPHGFHFGTEFFVALGVLFMVMFLIALWGLNHWVTKHRLNQQKKTLEVDLLTRLLKKRKIDSNQTFAPAEGGDSLGLGMFS